MNRQHMFAFVQDEHYAWAEALVTPNLYQAKKLARIQMVRQNKFPGFLREVLVAAHQIEWLLSVGEAPVFTLRATTAFDLSRMKHFVEITEKDMAEIIEKQMVGNE